LQAKKQGENEDSHRSESLSPHALIGRWRSAPCGDGV
jgi:hypothetical protein